MRCFGHFQARVPGGELFDLAGAIGSPSSTLGIGNRQARLSLSRRVQSIQPAGAAPPLLDPTSRPSRLPSADRVPTAGAWPTSPATQLPARHRSSDATGFPGRLFAERIFDLELDLRQLGRSNDWGKECVVVGQLGFF